MRRLALVAAALLALATLGACSPGKAGYGGATREVFLRACDPQADGGVRGTICGCAYEELTKRYSYEDYKRIDAQLQADPKDLPEPVVAIVADCATRSGASSSSDRSSSDRSRSDRSSSDRSDASS